MTGASVVLMLLSVWCAALAGWICNDVYREWRYKRIYESGHPK